MMTYVKVSIADADYYVFLQYFSSSAIRPFIVFTLILVLILLELSPNDNENAQIAYDAVEVWKINKSTA